MTTRPTDEEIRSTIEAMRGVCVRHKIKAGCIYDGIRMLDAWLAERQAARDGMTDEMVDHAIMISEGVRSIPKGGWGDKTRERMRAALQSIAQPVESPLIQYKKISAIYALDCPQGAQSKQESQLADALDSLWDKLTPGEQKDAETFTAKLSKAMLSVSPQPQQAVPDGWKLVPINADKVMRVAGEREWRHENLYRIWEAMLSAAPAYNGKKEG